MSNELLQQVKDEVARECGEYNSWEEMEKSIVHNYRPSIGIPFIRDAMEQVATLYAGRVNKPQQPVSMDEIEKQAIILCGNDQHLYSAQRDGFVKGAQWLLSRLPSPQGEIK